MCLSRKFSNRSLKQRAELNNLVVAYAIFRISNTRLEYHRDDFRSPDQ
jgi:hypothetical protein